MKAHVGGSTAGNLDLAAEIASKLFLVIFAVNALGFLVLLMAFRSFLVSTQAVFAIFLSVCAAFGVLTACFQFGWGLDLIGIDTEADGDPIASFVPLIMFAVLFGLSMDYQVFLMSQIEHARTQTKDPRKAVRDGLATGGRVISAAALIMMSVFGSFILNGDPTVKQFGVGLAVGVALAALCVLTAGPRDPDDGRQGGVVGAEVGRPLPADDRHRGHRPAGGQGGRQSRLPQAPGPRLDEALRDRSFRLMKSGSGLRARLIQKLLQLAQGDPARNVPLPVAIRAGDRLGPGRVPGAPLDLARSRSIAGGTGLPHVDGWTGLHSDRL